VLFRPGGEPGARLGVEADRIHIGTFTGPAGTFQQVTELAKPPATFSPA
jgi:hypothetical protein